MTGADRIGRGLYAVLPSTLLVACSSGAPTSNRAPDGGVARMDGGPQDSSSANVGVWQDISPPEFRTPSTMETLTVAVDPVHPNVVYATAGNVTNGGHQGTGVMKSADCGKSWTKISTGRNASHFDGGDLPARDLLGQPGALGCGGW